MGGSANFILVYGALRSGSTLLRLMLNGHPRLACPTESDFFFDHMSRRAGTWQIDAENLKRDFVFCYTRMTLADGPAKAQIASFADQSRKGRDMAALVLHRGIERALEFFPEIRIVHLTRDPRDVAASSIPMGWAGNVYCGVDHWIKTEDEWSRIRGQLKPGQATEVRYEDLIATPEATLTRICDFAGLHYDAAMLEYDGTSSYSKPDVAKIRQWRDRLGPRDVALVEAKLGGRLAAGGFARSGYPAVVLNARIDLANRIENIIKIWIFRIRKYGLADPVTVTLSRRMRLPKLGAGAQRRMDAKLLSSIK